MGTLFETLGNMVIGLVVCVVLVVAFGLFVAGTNKLLGKKPPDEQ